MDRQSIISTAVLFVFLVLAGFYAGFLADKENKQVKESDIYEANSSNEVVEASFDNRSIDLMYEDDRKAGMYLDLNKDGSFDREIDVRHDGKYHKVKELVEIENKTYDLHLKYIDWGNKTGDGEILFLKAVKK